jgi:hypothetical protein
LEKNRVLSYLGARSYSIYLWHWPVAVYVGGSGYRYFEILGIFISLVMGHLSYKYVERYSAGSSEGGGYFRRKIPLAIVFTSLAVGFSSYYSNGFATMRYGEDKGRDLDRIVQAIDDWDYPRPNYVFKNTQFRKISGNNSTPHLFLGDSLIEQYYPLVDSLVRSGKYPTSYFLTQGGCIPIAGLENINRSCKDLVRIFSGENEMVFDRIYVAGYWEKYLEEASIGSIWRLYGSVESEVSSKLITQYEQEIRDLFELLSNISNVVYFILPTPYGPEFNPKNMEELILSGQNYVGMPVEHYKSRNRSYYSFISRISETVGVELIDPMDTICENRCNIRDSEGRYFYKDDIHMRPWYVVEKVDYLN